MNQLSGTSLNARCMQQIDEHCNRFEQAYSSGETPRIQDYLSQADPAIHAELLSELALLEMHYHPQTTLSELCARFPQLRPDDLAVVSPEEQSEFQSIPGYFITQELGRGGMGVVYLATDRRLLRQVAVKMIHPSGLLQPEHRKRFIGEARAAARLHHPNLVQVFDAGEHLGQPYLVFEFVEGGTLAEQLRRRTFSFEESARLMEQICRGAHFAHQGHIIHRDLKPSNILMGTDGLPRIGDFGLAKRLDEDARQTVSGTLLGTPSYMAPEQAQGKLDTSHAAVDIYSLGAILYELLTGQPPFKAASVMETLELLRTKEPTGPRSINSRIPRDLETICLKCLQKEPARRYISASFVADDLSRFLRGDSIVARPAGVVGRTSRWCRRHPLPALLTMALATAILVGFVAVWTQWREADRQRQIASTHAQKYLAERNAAQAARAQAEAKSLEAERERANAEKHLAASESRFRKAQAPIEELIRLGSELVSQPEMNARGRQALARATGFLKDLLAEKGDDPQAMHATASAVSTFAWSLLEHGQFTDGEIAIREAREITARLVELEGGKILNRRLDQEVCFRHGIAYLRLEQYDLAERALRESVNASKRVLELPGSTSSDHIRLGATYSNLAIALIRKPEEAIEAKLRGIEVLRKCQADFASDTTLNSNLALALRNYASGLWSQDPKTAESLAVEALDMHRDLASQANASGESLALMVSNLLLLSNWYLQSEREQEGERLIAEALQRSQTARTRYPDLFKVRNICIDALRASYRLNFKRKNVEEAARDIELVISELDTAIKDFPAQESFKRIQAWMIHEQGNLHALQKGNAASIESHMQSLRRLRELQKTSSDPARYANDIKAVCTAISQVGHRFEFEAEKIESLRICLDASSNDAAICNKLAWRLVVVEDLELCNLEESAQLVRKAIELQPKQPFYYNTLGVILFYQNHLTEAEIAFNRSLELDTIAPASDWYFLSRIQYRHGNLQKAKELFQQAESWRQTKRPQDPELRLFSDETRTEISAVFNSP